MTADEFWEKKRDYFFPYNIGRRIRDRVFNYATVAQVEEPSIHNGSGGVSIIPRGPK
jgi:hypothetical protein